MTRTQIRVRARSAEDEPAVLALLEHVHATDGYPVHFPGARAFLLPPFEVAAWVAERDGEILGHVALHHDEDSKALTATCAATGLLPDEVLTVSRLFVAPSARRRGVAQALLAHATIDAQRRGGRPILDVVKGFDAAVRLYEHTGWTRVGEITWQLSDRSAVESLLYVLERS